MRKCLWLQVTVLAVCLWLPFEKEVAAAEETEGLIGADMAWGIPKITLSPNKRYRISVPTIQPNEVILPARHGLYEMETGKLLGALLSRTSPVSANHLGIEKTRWSSDSSLLLWRTAGKWSSWALEVVKIENNRIAWQLDLVDAGQKEILKRTQEAAPEAYRLKKEENKGSGEAYPDGFTVFIDVIEEEKSPIQLPLQVRVALTSNPKRSGLPDDALLSEPSCLESQLDGVVDDSGTFSVTKFRLLRTGIGRR